MKINSFILFITFCFGLNLSAQKTIPTADTLKIYGEVKNPMVLSLTQLDTFPKTAIKDQIIYNHNGEVKDTLTGLIGVPLKTIMASIEFIYDKPRELNEFYFVMIATDGYKVVFSWNEIYNSELGNNFFIITEMEGKPLNDISQRILFISTADFKPGRRYIKGLEKIEVRRVG